MAHMDPLVAMARDVLDGNRYLVLGTTEDDGSPRVSPVYFTHHDYRDFYWVSSPDARHSRNVIARPPVSIVVFDSSVASADARAVYLTATAEQVPEDRLAKECPRAFARPGKGAQPFAPEELRGAEPLRLYRATVTAHAVHIRGSDPTYGEGIDSRREITMP